MNQEIVKGFISVIKELEYHSRNKPSRIVDKLVVLVKEDKFNQPSSATDSIKFHIQCLSPIANVYNNVDNDNYELYVRFSKYVSTNIENMINEWIKFEINDDNLYNKYVLLSRI